MPTISGLSKPMGCDLIPGGPVGEHVVSGNLTPGDTLISVEHITDGTPPTRVDRTAEFSIHPTEANKVVNTTTDTTGTHLHVLWAKAE